MSDNLLFVAVCCALGATAAVTIADTPAITGSARVIDGDTIQIGSTHIRLWGIDAPEIDQPYGPDAKEYLARLLAGKYVICDPHDKDRYGRTVAHCNTFNIPDIGKQMVRAGYAWDWPRYSARAYASDEAYAQSFKLGLWASPATAPWEWRKQHPK